MRKLLTFAALVLLLSCIVQADPEDANSVLIRIVDCGQGLCTIIKYPGDHFIVVDAGVKVKGPNKFSYNEKLEYNSGYCAIKDQLAELIPCGPGDPAVIDLLVISHAHEDHYNAVPYIFDQYHVNKALMTGYENDHQGYFLNKWIVDAIENENSSNPNGCLDVMVEDYVESIGNPDANDGIYPVFDPDGDNVDNIDLLGGWRNPPSGGDDGNETSIVIRLTYGGHSVLFTGDSCGAGQDYMVENNIDISADVLIAPHHGSSTAMNDNFFLKIKPTYVIFSAGHFGSWSGDDYSPWQHPRQERVGFFTREAPGGCGVVSENIFRTDWGDNEGALECDIGRGTLDGPGDDSVDIKLNHDGTYTVEWARNDIDEHVRP